MNHTEESEHIKYEPLPSNADGISPGKWFRYHDYQHKDMIRAAQNAADTTLQTQWVFKPHDHADSNSVPYVQHDGRWWTTLAGIEPNERRALAGVGGDFPWRS